MNAKHVPRNFPQLFYSEGLCWKSVIRGRSRLRFGSYATQSSLGSDPAKTPRKQVTVIGDDGKVQWKDLSIREKAARTTQQSFNLSVIVTGLLMTVWLSSKINEILLIFEVGWRCIPPLHWDFLLRQQDTTVQPSGGQNKSRLSS